MNKRIIAALVLSVVFTCLILPVHAATTDDVEITPSDIRRIARTLYGECRADDVPTAEKAAVVWCILNRLDSPDFPNSIRKVVVRSQFHGYKASYPVLPELKEIVEDVVERWKLEKQGYENVGRTLPNDYYFFVADKPGHGNDFRKEYKSKELWDWSLPDPYTMEEYTEVMKYDK